MKMIDLLPVGSIVKTDLTKPISIMIIGYYPIDRNTSTCYQYAGALYPSGLSESNRVLLFNHNDIKKILFEGYATDGSRELIRNMSVSIESID